MALSLKPGVLFDRIDISILKALPDIETIFRGHGLDTVITSARDGEHMTNSLHYIGKAIDIRTREISPFILAEIHRECQDGLGSDYDVVLEKNHLHVEFDP